MTNALWFWGSQIDAAAEADKSRRLSGLIKDIIAASLVDPLLLKTSLEFSTVLEAGLLKIDEQAIQKRLIKINTGLVYRQQKYNLLREETEGYSKLVVVLCSLPVTAVMDDSENSEVEMSGYIRHINSLIGT